MESFWASLKKEQVHQQQYPTRAQARSDIFSYIESGLDRGSLPPPRDYTAAQWQAIHDMHGRVPQMVAISQRNYDRWLTLFVAAIIIAPLLTLLALHLLSGRKSPEMPKEG
jgi:hypothetical protein